MTKPPPQISRDTARSKAAARVGHECIVFGKVRVGKVFSYEEIDFRAPAIYGFSPEVLQEFWIAYIEPGDPIVISSSLVVLVSKATGEIVYIGFANDEG